MSKPRQYNNRLDIDGFPEELSKEDWKDLYHTLMAWGKRCAARNKQHEVQQQDSANDKINKCKWYGGDCGRGEKCSNECFEPHEGG